MSNLKSLDRETAKFLGISYDTQWSPTENHHQAVMVLERLRSLGCMPVINVYSKEYEMTLGGWDMRVFPNMPEDLRIKHESLAVAICKFAACVNASLLPHICPACLGSKNG